MDKSGAARHRTGVDRRDRRLPCANGAACSFRPICNRCADCDRYRPVGMAIQRIQTNHCRCSFRGAPKLLVFAFHDDLLVKRLTNNNAGFSNELEKRTSLDKVPKIASEEGFSTASLAIQRRSK